MKVELRFTSAPGAPRAELDALSATLPHRALKGEL